MASAAPFGLGEETEGTYEKPETLGIQLRFAGLNEVAESDGVTGQTTVQWDQFSNFESFFSDLDRDSLAEIRKKQIESKKPLIVWIDESTRKGNDREIRRLKRKLKKAGIRSELIEIPDEVSRSMDQIVDRRIPSELRHILVRPWPREWAVGLSMTAIQATYAFTIWMNAGLPMWKVVALTAFQSLITGAWSVGIHTFDNAFKRKLFGEPGETTSKWIEKARRLGWSAFLLEMCRLISGPVQGALPIGTWGGQLQIFQNLAANGTAGAWYATTRNRLFADDRKTTFWTSFNVFLISSLLNSIDIAGFFHTEFLGIKHSVWMILGAYTTLTIALHKAPGLFKRLAKKEDAFAKRVFRKIFRFRDWAYDKVHKTKDCEVELLPPPSNDQAA